MQITDGTAGRLGNDHGGCVSYESVGKIGRLNGARGRYQICRVSIEVGITAIVGYGLNSAGLGGPFVKLYP